jgi:hypothetical protein
MISRRLHTCGRPAASGDSMALMERFLFLCVCVLWLGVAASGAELAGMWTGQMPARNTETEDITFRFVQKGEALTGRAYLESEDVPITEGKIAGQEVRFVLTVRVIGKPVPFEFTGSFKDGELRLSRKRLDTTGGGGGNRQNQNQEFSLKRMF